MLVDVHSFVFVFSISSGRGRSGEKEKILLTTTDGIGRDSAARRWAQLHPSPSSSSLSFWWREVETERRKKEKRLPTTTDGIGNEKQAERNGPDPSLCDQWRRKENEDDTYGMELSSSVFVLLAEKKGDRRRCDQNETVLVRLCVVDGEERRSKTMRPEWNGHRPSLCGR